MQKAYLLNVTPKTKRFSDLSCSKFDLLGQTFCEFTSLNLYSLQLKSVKFHSECQIVQTLFKLEIACFVIITKKCLGCYLTRFLFTC